MRRLVVFVVLTGILSSFKFAHAQSLTEQARCAAQAREAAHDDNYKWDLQNRQMNLGFRTISFDYQSHYDTKLGHCFVLEMREVSLGSLIQTSKYLDDAFERRN
jgi:hypothetical protein